MAKCLKVHFLLNCIFSCISIVSCNVFVSFVCMCVYLSIFIYANKNIKTKKLLPQKITAAVARTLSGDATSDVRSIIVASQEYMIQGRDTHSYVAFATGDLKKICYWPRADCNYRKIGKNPLSRCSVAVLKIEQYWIGPQCSHLRMRVLLACFVYLVTFLASVFWTHRNLRILEDSYLDFYSVQCLGRKLYPYKIHCTHGS